MKRKLSLKWSASELWAGLGISLLLQLPALPATLTWDGGGVDNQLSTVPNWNTVLSPQNGDTLIFSGTNRLTPILDTNLNLAGISFSSMAGAFTLGGLGTYTLNGGGLLNSSTAMQQVQNDITLAANQSWNASAGALLIAGNVNTGNGGYALTINGARNTTLQGIVNGNGRLVKTGSGLLTLTGANSYTGGSTLSDGTISLGNATALGTGLISITGTGTLTLSAQGDTAIPNNVSVGKSFSFTGADDLFLNGAITLTGRRSLTVNGTGSLILNGNIGQSSTTARRLTKSGTGTLELNGINTFTGGTTASAGTLVLGRAEAVGSGTFTLGNATLVSRNGPLTLSGPFALSGNATFGGIHDITITSNFSLTSNRTLTVLNHTTLTGAISGSYTLTKAGSGTLMLAGSSTSNYSRGTVVRDGMLVLAKTSGTAFSGTSVTVGDSIGAADSAVLRLDRANQMPANTALSLKSDGWLNLQLYNASVASITTTGGRISGAGQITLGGNITTSATGTNITEISAGLVLNGDRGITVNNNSVTDDADLRISGPISVSSGTRSLTKSGTGTLLLSGNSTYNGTTNLNSGRVILDSSSSASPAFGPAGTGTINLGLLNSSSSASLYLGATPGLTVSNAINAQSSITGNTLTLGSLNTSGVNRFSGTLALNHNLVLATQAGGTLDLDGVISGSGTLTKTGDGTVRLGSANTFSGITTITAGTLSTKVSNSLGSGAVTVAGGTLELAAGQTDSIGQLILSNNGQLLGSTGSILTTTAAPDLQSGEVTLGLAGSAGLLKSTTGTVTLTGPGLWTGPTTVSAGTLRAGHHQGLPSLSALTLAEGATLDLNHFSGTLGSLAGGGTVQLGTGALTLGGNGDSTTFSGSIEGAGQLVKTGGGVLTLAAANGYTGNTGILGGTLKSGISGALPDSTAIHIGSGGTLDLNEFNETVGSLSGTGPILLGGGTLTTVSAEASTYGGIIGGTGGLTKAGDGTLTLGGSHSFSGTMNLQEGSIILSGPIGQFRSASSLTLGTGSSLILDNSSGENPARLPDNAPISLQGATLRLISDTNGTTESAGSLNAPTGASTVAVVHRGNSTDVTSLTFSSLGTIGNGATVNFLGVNGLLGDGLGGPRIYLNGQPAGLIGGWATVGADFATYSPARGVSAFSSYYLGSDGLNVHDSTASVQLSAASPSTAWGLTRDGITTNSGLNLTDAPVVDMGNSNTRTLNLSAGGLLKSSAVNTVISGSGRLTAGAVTTGNLAVSVTGPGTLTISSMITDNTGPDLTYGTSDDGIVSLSKADTGTLILSGINTYRGLTFLNGGILQISADQNLGHANNDLALSGGTLELTSGFTLNDGRVISIRADQSGTLSPAAGQILTLGAATDRLVTGNSSSVLFKMGAGLMVLPQANPSFTGQLRLRAGIVELQNANALGDVSERGRISLEGGTLLLRQDISTNFANSLSLTSDSIISTSRLTGTGPAVTHTLGTLTSGSQILTISGSDGAALAVGAVTLTGTTIFNPTTANLLLGSISGSAGFTKTGHGQLTMQGVGSYTGPTTIAAGSLRLGSTSSLPSLSAVSIQSGAQLDLAGLQVNAGSLAGAGNVSLGAGTLTTGGNNTSTTFSGSVAGSGNLTKTGTGTWILSGSNNYSGATTIAGGSLRWGASEVLPDSSALVLAANGTAQMAGYSDTVASLAGEGILTPGGGTLRFGGGNASSTFAGQLAGTGSLIKSGAGVFTLTGSSSSWSGNLQADAGVLKLESNLGAGGILARITVNVSAEMLLASGLLASTGSLYLSGTGVNGGGALQVTSGSAFWGGNTFLTGSSRIQSSGMQLTIAGSISLGSHALTISGTGETVLEETISGSGSLVKTGTGTTWLNGSSTFTGQVSLQQGTLAVGHANAFGSSSQGTVVTNGAGLLFNEPAGVVVSAEPLSLQGSGPSGTGAIRNLAGNSQWSGPITLAASATVNVEDDVLTLGRIISGSTAAHLTKTGTGTLVLDGDNTYQGNTIVQGGTLLLGDSERIPDTSALTVHSGASLMMEDLDETVGSISGAGIINTGDSPTEPSLLTFGSNNVSALFTGNISGTGSISYSGSGEWSVESVQSFSGRTIVRSGTVNVGGFSGSLSASAGIDIFGGTLRLSGSNSDRLGNSAPVMLGGGGSTASILLSGSITESAGSLTISGSSVIDFGSGSGRLFFSSSKDNAWAGNLAVWNWTGSNNGGGTDQLNFGSNKGLTDAQASSVAFYTGSGTGSLGSGKLLNNGELVPDPTTLTPVPEPGALLAVGMLVFALTHHETSRRRPRNPAPASC